MAAHRRKNQLFHSLQFLFSHPAGFATRVHPVQGYLHFSISVLLFAPWATLFAPQKHLTAASRTPKPGNGTLPIRKAQPRPFPYRSPFAQPHYDHPDSHLHFVLVQVLRTPILVHEQALVNGFVKHLFGFVELHKPKIFFLADFYRLIIWGPVSSMASQKQRPIVGDGYHPSHKIYFPREGQCPSPTRAL